MDIFRRDVDYVYRREKGSLEGGGGCGDIIILKDTDGCNKGIQIYLEDIIDKVKGYKETKERTPPLAHQVANVGRRNSLTA